MEKTAKKTETNSYMTITGNFVEGLNVASVSAIISIIITVFGIVLAFLQVQDTGVIDIKTPFLTGKFESGFVGVTFIFLGAVLGGLCLRTVQKREIKIKIGDAFLVMKGPFSRRALFEFLKSVSNKENEEFESEADLSVNEPD